MSHTMGTTWLGEAGGSSRPSLGRMEPLLALDSGH